MLKLLLAKSNPQIKDYVASVEKVVAEVNKLAVDKLKLDFDIDVIVRTSIFGVWNESGIDCDAINVNLIQIYIYFDDINPDAFAGNLTVLLLQEIIRCIRAKRVYGSLDALDKAPICDNVITLGLSQGVSRELLGDKADIPDAGTADKIIDAIKPYFNVQNTDSEHCPFNKYWMYAGDEKYDLPKNTGYIVGYWLLKRYLAKSSRSFTDILLDNISAAEVIKCANC